jgi:hypothetical protein
MKPLLVSAIALPLLLPLSTSVLADDDDSWSWNRGPGFGMMMGRMTAIDSNNDNIISDDEAASQVESVFLVMDADEDSELTEEEYMAVDIGPGFAGMRNADRQKMMQQRKKARFVEMDADKNGKVSKAEFIAAGKARFDAADTDKDGKVTPWEFRAQRWR